MHSKVLLFFLLVLVLLLLVLLLLVSHLLHLTVLSYFTFLPKLENYIFYLLSPEILAASPACYMQEQAVREGETPDHSHHLV